VSRVKHATGVGYVLRKFPILSETFILNEILAVEARGLPIHIFSMAPTRDPRFHENLSKLRAPVSYIPGVSEFKTLIRYNAQAAKRNPRRYSRALFYVLSKFKLGLVWRFLQAGYIAERARRLGLRSFHAHFASRPTTVALLASRISGIPYSFTAHAYDIYYTDSNSKVLARKLDDAEFVVTISDYNKAFLESRFNGATNKIVRIYNGIDLQTFAPNGEPPSTPFTIVSVARLVEKKGLSYLIEACRHLRDRGIEFRCLIIGKGRLRSHLDGLIKQWDLRKKVQLLGVCSQSEVLQRYREAHLFVLPCVIDDRGNRDGLPVSIVEALACGLPVITTSVTGIPEVVQDGHNGIIIPESEPVELADAIESVISDAQLYQHLQENSRASVVTNFDLTKSANSMHQLFDEVGP
jgi:glycosyltransferase involved in cell wall biosynthesis